MMSLDQLLFEVTSHYRSRGFPQSALKHLRWTLVSNASSDGSISLDTAYPGCSKKASDLLGHFLPEQRIVPDQKSKVDALFGFAFGYRMLVWPSSNPPTDSCEVARNRLPGLNNAALAEQARVLQRELNRPLFLQFEIADAISGSADRLYSSRRVDQGTYGVAKEFDDELKRSGKSVQSVVIVAHRHHYERCRVILERSFNITGLSPPDLYSGYDPCEAQPRVMSPEEYIVNDFASMAGMVA